MQPEFTKELGRLNFSVLCLSTVQYCCAIFKFFITSQLDRPFMSEKIVGAHCTARL